MLILPAEHKINWRSPPYATLILIALNVFIFFSFSTRDNELWREAYQYYVSNGLHKFEAQEYADYLQRVTNLKQDTRKELAERVVRAVNDGQIAPIIPVMMEDRKFVLYMQANGLNFLDPDVFNRWQQLRASLDQNYLSQLSHWRMGIIPAGIQLPDLLSYQFLHGGLDHLLGNMIILFLVGFAVENILGKALYLTAYLTAGALGGIAFALSEPTSMTPLVGASASISGLMGMYVMYYRLQKIRFFYFIVVYFNYFRAPALLILPYWLGKEIYEYWSSDNSMIAYMAHIGGLLAGAAIMWPWVRWYQHSSLPEKTTEEVDLEYREKKHEALKAVSRVEFDKARVMFAKLHDHYPHDNDITLHLFHLYKLHPADAECQHYTQLALDTSLSRNDLDQAFQVWQEYHKYAADQPLSDYRYEIRLLTACLNSNRLNEAEIILDKITTSVTDPNLLAEAYGMAVDIFARQQMQIKSRKYQKLLDELKRQNPPLLT